MEKRIRVISPTPTHPAIRGNRARIGSMISGLKSIGHEVHLLHVEMECGDRNEMKKAWGEQYHSAPYHKGRGNLARRVMKKLTTFVDDGSRFRLRVDEW